MKPFKTIEEQIQLLRERKLVIENETYAKDYLLSNNYYNIINGYSKYFPLENETYKSGTTFEEVECLYRFDRDLKQAFFKAILSVELHLKSIFAYYFGESYGGKPYSYLNIESYDRNKTLSVIPTIARLAQIISRQQKYPNTSVYHYVNKHQDVPLWVLVNYLDFGEIRCMLDSSELSLQNKVAKDMYKFAKQNLTNVGTFPPETMMSFVENINEVRNVCAHNNRMLDFQCRRDSKYWTDLHERYNISADTQRRNIFSVFVSTQCFLSRMEYSTLYNTILKLMKSLSKNLKTASADSILESLGFPLDWYNNPKMQV